MDSTTQAIAIAGGVVAGVIVVSTGLWWPVIPVAVAVAVVRAATTVYNAQPDPPKPPPKGKGPKK